MPMTPEEQDFIKKYLQSQQYSSPEGTFRAQESADRSALMGAVGSGLNTISRAAGAQNLSDEPYQQMAASGQQAVNQESARQKSVRDYLANKAELGLKQKHFGIQEKTLESDLAYKKAMLEAEKNKSGQAATKEGRETETGLRKELAGLDIMKQTPILQKSVETIRNSASKPSAAGDVSLIFAYMKMIDPTSSVKESEQATAKNAAGVPDKIRNMFNEARSGMMLNSKQRQDFLSQSESMLNNHMKLVSAEEDRYGKLSESYGVKKENVVPKREPQKESVSVRAKRTSDGKTVTIAGTQKEVSDELAKGIYEVLK